MYQIFMRMQETRDDGSWADLPIPGPLTIPMPDVPFGEIMSFYHALPAAWELMPMPNDVLSITLNDDGHDAPTVTVIGAMKALLHATEQYHLMIALQAAAEVSLVEAEARYLADNNKSAKDVFGTGTLEQEMARQRLFPTECEAVSGSNINVLIAKGQLEMAKVLVRYAWAKINVNLAERTE